MLKGVCVCGGGGGQKCLEARVRKKKLQTHNFPTEKENHKKRSKAVLSMDIDIQLGRNAI